MSQIEVDKIIPQSGTSLQVGDSGDTISIPAGATFNASAGTFTLPDGSVVEAKIASNAVTTSKINNSAVTNDKLAGSIANAKLANSAITINGSSVSLGGSATIEAGTDWQTGSIKTSNFTAADGKGYFVDTSSGAVTANLPAGSAGAIVAFADYKRTFNTNNLTISPNGSEKIGGVAASAKMNVKGQAGTFVYVDGTQGWINVQNAEDTETGAAAYSVDFLCIAGGGGGGGPQGAYGGGGGGAGGYRASYNNESSGGGGSSETALTFNSSTVYTITVGGGGAAGGSNSNGVAGQNSSIVGSDITDINSIGGGYGGSSSNAGGSGGSGGGGGYNQAGGSGTSNQGYAGGAGVADSNDGKGGGGGAGATGANGTGSTGGNGGTGVASTITGSSVTRAGGGGGGSGAGSGSGGSGGATGAGGGNATANTGSGAGGASGGSTNAGVGATGVVILRMPTANYSGTTTGVPTVTTSGSDTILTFTGSGSYTG